jgi:hypothetical protein
MSLQAAAIYQNPSLVRDVRNREVLFVFLKKKQRSEMSEIYWATRMKENRRRNCNEFPMELGIWVPRDLSARDASNTNKKIGSSEFEAGGWIDIEGKAKEAKRKAQNFFSSFDAKTLVSTGSFGKWNEDAEWEVVRFGVSFSFISTVAELLSARRSLFILFLSGCRAT